MSAQFCYPHLYAHYLARFFVLARLAAQRCRMRSASLLRPAGVIWRVRADAVFFDVFAADD